VALRVGLIGAGGIGALRARALSRCDRCDLVAVADLDADLARQAAASAGPPDVREYADYRALLEAGGLDAVVVSTPPASHESIGLAALDAGLHVLCEKPLANSPAAARRMVERASQAGRVLATGFNHRYFPAIARVREAVESGEIGELSHVRGYAGHVGLPELQGAPWLTDPEAMGGGALLDNGIHVLDLVRHVLGEVHDVSGLVSESVWKIPGAEDNGIALLRSNEGRIASLHASWTEWRGYRFWLAAYGDRGTAWAYYAPMLGLVVQLDEPGGKAKRRLSLYPRINLREKFRGWQSTVVQTFVEEFTDFRGRIEGGSGHASRLATGFDGFRAVEIANAVRQSAERREVVTLCEPF
jgi:predicted dehydrogenase